MRFADIGSALDVGGVEAIAIRDEGGSGMAYENFRILILFPHQYLYIKNIIIHKNVNNNC